MCFCFDFKIESKISAVNSNIISDSILSAWTIGSSQSTKHSTVDLNFGQQSNAVSGSVTIEKGGPPLCPQTSWQYERTEQFKDKWAYHHIAIEGLEKFTMYRFNVSDKVGKTVTVLQSTLPGDFYTIQQ